MTYIIGDRLRVALALCRVFSQEENDPALSASKFSADGRLVWPRSNDDLTSLPCQRQGGCTMIILSGLHDKGALSCSGHGPITVPC